MRGDQTVDGLALGSHRAPLGAGDALGDIGQLIRAPMSGETARSEVQRADQRAMDDKIGVAADRRSEMRVAAQGSGRNGRSSDGVFGLRLRAQARLR